jgi:hypothetical protein
MRPLASLLVLAARISPAPAAGSSLVRAPVEDVGLPFWCDWGYDWNERCFRDDTARLPVGGVDDKVWRAALGFSLEGLPARAAITSARLDLLRRRVRGAGSPGRPMSRRRVHARCARDPQRELDKGARGRPDPVVTASTRVPTTSAAWSSWDLSSLVSDWASEACRTAGCCSSWPRKRRTTGRAGPASRRARHVGHAPPAAVHLVRRPRRGGSRPDHAAS